MRLNQHQRIAIHSEVAQIFGPSATVRLFGSRVEDAARGGDIDLYIEASGTPAELLDRELKLRAALMRRLGERRIGAVVHALDRPLRPIDIEARRTGVVL